MKYLGVTATFDVEDTVIRPAMLIITDESTVGISRQSRLTRSRQTKEQSDVSIFTLIRGRMESEHVMPDRHKIEHDSEDALLHLTGIFCTKDHHLLRLEVDGDTGAWGHTGGIPISRERTGVVNCEIGTSISLHLLFCGTDKHISHEETVVCPCTNNSDFDPVTSIPSSISVKDVDSGSGIEVINRTFTINLPDSFFHGFIDWSPPDILCGFRLIDNSFVWSVSQNQGSTFFWGGSHYLAGNDRSCYRMK